MNKTLFFLLFNYTSHEPLRISEICRSCKCGLHEHVTLDAYVYHLTSKEHNAFVGFLLCSIYLNLK